MGELTDSLRRSRPVKPHRMPEWWPLARLVGGGLLGLGLLVSLVVRAGGDPTPEDAAPVVTQPPLVTVAPPASGTLDTTSTPTTTPAGGSVVPSSVPPVPSTAASSSLPAFSLLADRSVKLVDTTGAQTALPAGMWDAVLSAVTAEQVRDGDAPSPATGALLRSVLGATVALDVATADGTVWSVTATQQPGGTGWVALATSAV